MARPRPRALRIARVRLRRTMRRLGRSTPEWMKWLTPWGTSLALHALLLLLLALAVRAMNPPGVVREERIIGQIGDELSTVGPGERSGDPFTKLQTDDPPSLSLEKNPPADGEIRLPRLPDGVALGPPINVVPHETSGFSIPGPEPKGVDLSGTGKPRVMGKAVGGAGAFDPNLPLMAPFSGRTDATERAKLVRREGGTVESEKAVEAGIDWIARHQRADGGWALNTHYACVGEGCPDDGPLMFSDTAATGLALLPMLAAGHTHTKPGKYKKTIEKGLFWLVKMQRPDGQIFTTGSDHTPYYSHAIASMALCEAYGLTKDKRLRDPAQKSIYFINRGQTKTDGGWRYFPQQAGDTSVFGWQIFAMRSAHLAGLQTNRTVLKRARDYLNAAAKDATGASYGYQVNWAPSYTMTAEGLVCRQLMGWPREHPGMLAGTSAVAEHLMQSEDRNVYYWYYATQLLHNMRNKDWDRWNVRVRDGLISMQTGGKTCDRGSWDPSLPEPDRWGIQGGRLYVTSLSLLTLEVYYRYLPLYRDPLDEMPGSDLDTDETKAARKEEATKRP